MTAPDQDKSTVWCIFNRNCLVFILEALWSLPDDLLRISGATEGHRVPLQGRLGGPQAVRATAQ